jgi:hypothetical protein
LDFSDDGDVRISDIMYSVSVCMRVRRSESERET